jgi:hypothetical protein
MARTYSRDSKGRFSGGGGVGGGGSKRPATREISRSTNRLTRDNSGRITSVGGSGATAYGGRIKTASGKLRATQTARTAASRPSGTIKGKVKRDPGAAGKIGQNKRPAAQGLNRPDTAASNIPMRGARGRRLDAEISRNVAQQKAASRAAGRASNRQLRSDQARAKKLRSVHEKALITTYSAKMGKSAAEVRDSIRSLEPSRQVKLFKQFVKENRSSLLKAAQPSKGSLAYSKIEQAKGRVSQFTAMKKATDIEIRKVRQQIKDARSNAVSFGAVPGLRLKLLELQSQSKLHRDRISTAKAAISQ